MDPRAVSPEPLAILLPAHRDEYVFRHAGTGRMSGRASVMLDYRATSPAPADVRWEGSCVSIDLPGRTAGRIWVDPTTAEVLRFDERLIGRFELALPAAQQLRGGARSMTIERADTSIRYKRVAFHEPEETLMLPASIDSLTVIRNSGVPRLRTIQVFSGYRRFMTEGRVVKNP